MAEHEHGEMTSGMDYAEHERTYTRFVMMIKYGSIAVILFIILLALIYI